ncbi:hypothetical protein [Novosphingobium sp.]|uniref:hypothetical protein n=1 Tax=Novosphingobium sp. TaxID=1874826 RepID=UPI0035658C1D
MMFSELLAKLPVVNCDGLTFPLRLLGAFRRKSITFADGMTDETTVVYWFQSKTFTIDLRLPDGPVTPLLERQGWVGDTLWDNTVRQLSWTINRSYQPRNQWPEPALLSFMGNCVLEFAPSGAYVEDWRQQSVSGPLLGLRLVSLFNAVTGQTQVMDGGLIIAGHHAAYAQSRLPGVDAKLKEAGDMAKALEKGVVTRDEISSYEVSVAVDDQAITHSTRPERIGQGITYGDFEIAGNGAIILSKVIDGAPCQLRFTIDCYVPDFAFSNTTPTTPDAAAWVEQEKAHLKRNAIIMR